MPEASSGDPARSRLEANWKERLEQPYVYLEKRGDYRDLGEAMHRLLEEARALGLRGDGPPFALFFDDPGKVALSELRARVCFPVGERPAGTGALQYELLPRAMVVYARVPGAHAAVAHAYPALFSYLRELGWRPGGPVREVYLMKEGENSEEFVTEVQIPWTARDEPPSPLAERN
jgi:effector-binding domain-containing protein